MIDKVENYKIKKILKNPFMGNFFILMIVFIVGSLFIFTLTKILSTEGRSYKDLVLEMSSKTFGNHWIAAFELSKYLSAQKIPDDDIPWLISSLEEIYGSSVDERIKKFIIIAISSLKDKRSLDFFTKILRDSKVSNELLFHTLTAIADLPKGVDIDWKYLTTFLNSKDPLIRQAVLLTLGTHKVLSAVPYMRKKLEDPEVTVQYSAALSLGTFKDSSAIPLLKEILVDPPAVLTREQRRGLQMNILKIIEERQWKEFIPSLREFLKGEKKDAQLVSRTRIILKQLINSDILSIINI